MFLRLKDHRILLLGIVISAFILSVVIRLPYIYQVDWLSSHALRTQQIWYENGAVANKFLPIVTYQNNSDRNINNQGHEIDKKGDYYYISYPPFSYIFSYLMFRFFNIYPNILFLQILNMVIHLFCCLFVYWIIGVITRKDYVRKMNMSALVGMGVYLFSPATLLFHSQTYFADILVQLFFLMGTFIFLRIIKDGFSRRDCVGLGLVCFLMIYTEWLGVFFAFAVGLYLLFNLKRSGMKTVLLTVTLSSIASLILIVGQYCLINGSKNLVIAMFKTYQLRNGLTSASEYNFTFWNIDSWRNLVIFYRDGYLPFLILFIFFLFNSYILKVFRKIGIDNLEKTTLYLCVVPVLLHHLFLFNHYVVHSFSVVKDGVILSLLTAFFYRRIICNEVQYKCFNLKG
ncbi:MAG: hypothetical protein WCH62_03810, partial [Candidatus Omnitrophota bacterium]